MHSTAFHNPPMHTNNKHKAQLAKWHKIWGWCESTVVSFLSSLVGILRYMRLFLSRKPFCDLLVCMCMYVCGCVLVYMCMLVCTCMYVHIVHPPLWYMFWGWEQNRPLCWSCPLTSLSPLACSVCGMAMGQERMKEWKRAMTKYMGQFESIPLPEWKHHHSSWSLWQWAGEKQGNPFQYATHL